jgi:hypothetical protein
VLTISREKQSFVMYYPLVIRFLLIIDHIYPFNARIEVLHCRFQRRKVKILSSNYALKPSNPQYTRMSVKVTKKELLADELLFGATERAEVKC